jgi:hypothetical protein
MSTKTKKTIFITHKGIAQYPWLNKPDTQFDADGVYKCNLIVPTDHTKEIREVVNKVAEEEFGKTKVKNARLPFKVDEETGHSIIITKSKFEPKFCDATGNIITGDIPKLWGGSTLKLAGYVSPYSAAGNIGISLHLTKVQIINPVGGDADDGISFGEEKDGFIAEQDEINLAAEQASADETDNPKYNF